MSGLALVTGASTGIGRAIAEEAARDGYDLIVVADEPEILTAADELRAHGRTVEPLQIDLSTVEGVERMWASMAGRLPDVVVANAGIGFGDHFAAQSWDQVARTIGVNVTGTTKLLHLAVRAMLERGQGRILVTGSIAGFVPGANMAAYSASKAWVDSLAAAISAEIAETEVTLTCLMPNATDTEFFARAGMEDTALGQGPKADPADVARAAWEGTLAGQREVTPGLLTKAIKAVAGLMPQPVLAQLNRIGAAKAGD